MTRIHNIALLRILTIVVLFSTFYNILALSADFVVMEYISLTAMPILFVVSINLLNKRSSMWMLFPLSIYLIERFIIYMAFGIDNLSDGNTFVDLWPIFGVFLQINGLRFILVFTGVSLMIAFITSMQKKWFYKLHKFLVVILIIQIIEYGFYLFNEYGKSSLSIIEMIIILPNFLYFIIFAIYMTRIHLFEIYVELGNIETEKSKIPKTFQKNPIPQQNTSRGIPIPQDVIRPSNQKNPNQQPSLKPNTQRPTRPQPNPNTYRNTQLQCPQCKSQNQSPPFCKNCGQDLR